MSTVLYAPVFDTSYAAVHSFGMRHNILKLLRKMMEAGQLNQAGLAARLGKKVTQPQISRWLRGQDPDVPNYERIVAVAESMGVISDVRSEDVAASLPDRPNRKAVKLKGYVGAGSEAHFYKISDEDFEEVPALGNATDRTVAVQIRGKSWGPAMDTWLVFYDDVRSPIDPSMYGKPCIVGLADDRILLKIVTRQANGLYRLLSNSDEPPIEDAEIEWAAVVTGMAPRA